MIRETLLDGAGDEFISHDVSVSDQLGLVFVVSTEGAVITLPTNQFSGLPGQIFCEIGNVPQENRIRHGAPRSNLSKSEGASLA